MDKGTDNHWTARTNAFTDYYAEIVANANPRTGNEGSGTPDERKEGAHEDNQSGTSEARKSESAVLRERVRKSVHEARQRGSEASRIFVEIATAVEQLTPESTGFDVDQILNRLARVAECTARDDLIGLISDLTGRHKSKLADALRVEAARIKREPSENRGNNRLSPALLREVKRFDNIFAYVRIGADGRIAKFPPKANDPIEFMKVETFHNTYAPERVDGIAVSRSWMTWEKRRTFENVVFDPSGNCSDDVLNLWRGFSVAGRQGDWSLLRRHLFEVVCRRNPLWFTWVVCWLSNLVQTPARKPGTAVVVKGLKGTGKTKCAEWISALAPNNSLIIAKGDQILGRFNKHLAQSIFTCMEEAFWAGDKAGEGVLKDLITGGWQMIEGKGVDAIKVANHNRLWICSNSDWAVPATGDERRFLVLHTSADHQQDIPYFKAIDKQMNDGGLAAMMRDLRTIVAPTWIELRKPPVTPWLTEQIAHSLPALESWWQSVLTDGTVAGFEWKDEESLVVPSDCMWEAFRDSARATRTRANKEQLGRFMKGIGVHRTRPRSTPCAQNIGLRTRQWCYELPPISDLRAAFTKKHGIRFEDGGGFQGEDFSAWGLPDVEANAVAYRAWHIYGEGGARP